MSYIKEPFARMGDPLALGLAEPDRYFWAADLPERPKWAMKMEQVPSLMREAPTIHFRLDGVENHGDHRNSFTAQEMRMVLEDRRLYTKTYWYLNGATLWRHEVVRDYGNLINEVAK